jgi:hypothetical protein
MEISKGLKRLTWSNSSQPIAMASDDAQVAVNRRVVGSNPT